MSNETRRLGRRDFQKLLGAGAWALACDGERGLQPGAQHPITSNQGVAPRPEGSPERSRESSAASIESVNVTPATARVVLGKSGLSVPRLALGTGSGGWARESDQTRLGQAAFTELMRAGFERGARFIDAADLYGSHSFVRSALNALNLPREQYTLLTKVWFAPGAPKMPETTTARPEVERFLRELGVDWLDIVLIHCVTDPAWPKQQARMRDELSELKAKGIIRAIGCSCHSHAALSVAADDPWVDVILARINPGNERMDEDASVNDVAATLKRARANGKGVIGMKIYGAGDFASPEQRRQSLRYAVSNDLVDAMTIGHVSVEQLDDTINNLNTALEA